MTNRCSRSVPLDGFFNLSYSSNDCSRRLFEASSKLTECVRFFGELLRSRLLCSSTFLKALVAVSEDQLAFVSNRKHTILTLKKAIKKFNCLVVHSTKEFSGK